MVAFASRVDALDITAVQQYAGIAKEELASRGAGTQMWRMTSSSLLSVTLCWGKSEYAYHTIPCLCHHLEPRSCTAKVVLRDQNTLFLDLVMTVPRVPLLLQLQTTFSPLIKQLMVGQMMPIAVAVLSQLIPIIVSAHSIGIVLLYYLVQASLSRNKPLTYPKKKKTHPLEA